MGWRCQRLVWYHMVSVRHQLENVKKLKTMDAGVQLEQCCSILHRLHELDVQASIVLCYVLNNIFSLSLFLSPLKMFSEKSVIDRQNCLCSVTVENMAVDQNNTGKRGFVCRPANFKDKI